MMESWKIVMICFLLLNIVSYLSIRDILWSIVRQNKHWKDKKYKEFLRNAKDNETFFRRIDMGYLQQYLKNYTKDFSYWLSVKRIFTILETLLFLIYVVSHQNWFSLNIPMWFGSALLLQSGIIFVILRFQFGIDGHMTKYDRTRYK